MKNIRIRATVYKINTKKNNKKNEKFIPEPGPVVSAPKPNHAID